MPVNETILCSLRVYILRKEEKNKRGNAQLRVHEEDSSANEGEEGDLCWGGGSGL